MTNIKKEDEMKLLKPSDYSGSAQGVGVHTQDQAAIREKMNANSKAWWETEDPTERARLEGENKAYASQLGSGVTFDEETGYWNGTANAPQNTTFDMNQYLAANPKPVADTSYSAWVNDAMQSILNRKPFSYDYSTDPLYQQLAESYTQKGQRAMQDTLGQVSARTGGMASSYAGTAAQESYNQYMSEFSDRIPELRQLAYEMYMDDLNMQRQDLGLLMDMDQMNYGRYQDSLNNWYSDRDFAYGAAQDALNNEWQQKQWDYGLEQDALDNAWREKEWDYKVEQDALDNAWREKEMDYTSSKNAKGDAYDKAMDFLDMGVMPDSSILEAAGISQAEAAAYLSGVKKKNGDNEAAVVEADYSLKGVPKTIYDRAVEEMASAGYDPEVAFDFINRYANNDTDKANILGTLAKNDEIFKEYLVSIGVIED